MIRPEEVFRIGRLGKTHGVKGELTFAFDNDVFDRVDADYLVLEVEGILVPFFFEEYRFRSDTTAIVKFEGVDSVERARELVNVDVFFPRSLTPADDDGPLQWSFLVGFSLIDAKSGANVGTIAAIDDQTENVLLELEDGRLVPAADELIAALDQAARTITIDIPQGLLDI